MVTQEQQPRSPKNNNHGHPRTTTKVTKEHNAAGYNNASVAKRHCLQNRSKGGDVNNFTTLHNYHPCIKLITYIHAPSDKKNK